MFTYSLEPKRLSWVHWASSWGLNTLPWVHRPPSWDDSKLSWEANQSFLGAYDPSWGIFSPSWEASSLSWGIILLPGMVEYVLGHGILALRPLSQARAEGHFTGAKPAISLCGKHLKRCENIATRQYGYSSWHKGIFGFLDKAQTHYRCPLSPFVIDVLLNVMELVKDLLPPLFQPHPIEMQSQAPVKIIYLPLGERALHWVQRYLQGVRPRLLCDHQEHTLFLTDYGEPFKGSYLGHHVKKYIEQAGIHKTGSCHLFRYAMATHMLENGADICFIQAVLGHEDLSTTEIYTRVSIEKLQEIHRVTHPAKWQEQVESDKGPVSE